MTQVRHRSTFLGPHHAFYQQADWPAPCRYHLQLHDMLPGSLWNAPEWAIMIQPHILTPTGLWNHWKKGGPPFFYQYKQRLDDIRILVQKFVPVHTFFYIQLKIGETKFAYNELHTPVGVFAYGGSATLSREYT